MTLALTCPVCKKKSYTRTGTISHLFNVTKTELMDKYILGLPIVTRHSTWMRFHLKEKKKGFTLS